MPRDTFYNLKPEKKKAIETAFLEEFSQKTFEDASISQVVKSLGIAKGSIYQYFENKLDLYLHLKSECEKTKLAYIMGLNRKDFPDFWKYFRKMYEVGVLFYLEHPLASKFLSAIGKNTHSPTIKSYIHDWRDQAHQIFEEMIRVEVKAGNFRKDVSIKTMSFFLVSASTSIGEYMEVLYDIDFNKALAKGQKDFARQQKILLQSVDDYILLLQKAFEK